MVDQIHKLKAERSKLSDRLSAIVADQKADRARLYEQQARDTASIRERLGQIDSELRSLRARQHHAIEKAPPEVRAEMERLGDVAQQAEREATELQRRLQHPGDARTQGDESRARNNPKRLKRELAEAEQRVAEANRQIENIIAELCQSA